MIFYLENWVKRRYIKIQHYGSPENNTTGTRQSLMHIRKASTERKSFLMRPVYEDDIILL